GGAGGGLLASLGLSGITFWDSLLGLLLGGGILFIVAYGYYKLRKIEGMGGGDIKLLGMIGSWLGYKSIVQVVLIGSVAGILVGLPMILIKKDRYFQIPFGPFLSGAAIFVLLLDLIHLKIFLF
ncbi:MAG: prepilin peptidase, partial [Desulfatiglandales bacterium]